MEITIWGARGGIPSPSRNTQRYGGNTSCLSVRARGGELLVFDAGSGIRLLGDNLPKNGECSLFITHGHNDHIQGLVFWAPLFNKDWTIHIYRPEWLKDIPERIFDGTLFPVHFHELQSNITLHPLTNGQSVQIGGATVTAMATNHPGGNLAYKVSVDGSTFLYTGDHELTGDSRVRDMTAGLLAGVDVALVDAQYAREDYHPGWGHSRMEDWVQPALDAGVSRLVFSHHAPERGDAELELALKRLQREYSGKPIEISLAREGLDESEEERFDAASQRADIVDFINELSRYSEENVLLDRILAECRRVTNADAGTVFLADGGDLIFAYTHNDTLFPSNAAYKHAYANARLPLDTHSIGGYVGVTRNILNIPDVRGLPPGLPYGFNEDFDKKTNYRTESMLTLPLVGRGDRLLGVLQIINSMDPETGRAQPFSRGMEHHVKLLANQAARALELSGLLREDIKRLLHMATLHDPMETGPHAERVGAIAAEIYQHHAEKRNEDPDTLRHFRSRLRLASMLHDLGKVAIPDSILKKPGKLDDAEFTVMRSHTVAGSTLFLSGNWDITMLAHDITLHHHQKWNGTGYSGSPSIPVLAGRDIPLAARITAIADVFDALVSTRCYKKSWTWEEGRAMIRKDAGTHFDPDLVESFMAVDDLLRKIYIRYPD